MPEPIDPNAAPAAPPAVDPSQPAAGGWVPTPMQQAMGVGAVSFLMGLAPVFLELPGVAGKVCAGVCGALALGVGTFLGIKSAGPRRLP